jgi:hypothetical protein
MAMQWWKEARGSAIWDGIKWLWAMGGSAVTTAIQWIVGVATGHPNLTALFIMALVTAFFGVVAIVVHAKPQPKTAPSDAADASDEPVSLVYQHEMSREQLEELREFNILSNEFHALSWAQQAALAQLWRMTSCSFDSLCNQLGRYGFGTDAGKLVSPLCQSKFVETTQGQGGLDMCIHPARKKNIRKLLEQWKACVL